MTLASLVSRVSFFFALMMYQVAVFRYHAAWLLKNFQAVAFAWKARRMAGVSAAFCRFS